MSFLNCPFCQQSVPAAELNRHANSHFEDEEINNHVKDEELAMDFTLAQAIEVSSMTPSQIWVDNAKPCESQKRKFPESSSTRCQGRISCSEELNNHFINEDKELTYDIELGHTIELSLRDLPPILVDDAKPCEIQVPVISESSSTKYEGRISGGSSDVEEKIGHLTSLQIRETYYKVKDGMISLLKNCLEVDSENSISILSGYVDHFRSTKSEDVGWGCGWRNIQMLSSHLLMQRQEVREVLFGGSGFVPDIVSLQRWLEIAWERGFDPLGSNAFNCQIYGKKDWIGTTECATIFRSFGIHARIVDFCSKLNKSTSETGKFGLSIGKKAAQVYGPMDRFLSRGDDCIPEVGSSGNGKDGYMSNYPGKAKDEQRLIDWVWSYFSDGRLNESGQNRVILSEKAPLYFQHDGHSRTIIGIQVKRSCNGMKQYNLLILDPAHQTEVLERSLRWNSGWQRFIKRGDHTLKKLEYQLCYIDPGIVTGKDMEKLKTLNSVLLEF